MENLPSAEDMMNLLREGKNLFNQATEPSNLKQTARALRDAREKEEDVLKQGAKALIHALANSTDEEQEAVTREIRELEEQCSRLEKELDALRLESDAAVREDRLREEVRELETHEMEKEERFQELGGEAVFRRRPTGSATTSSVNMKRMLSLFKNITRIRWDLDCDEEDSVGAIVDEKENVIKQFRFGPIKDQNGDMDEFKLANKIWQTIA